MIKPLIFAILLLSSNLSAVAQEKPIYLGVLEEVPGTLEGEKSAMKVRAMFVHQNQKWRALKNECANTECLKTITSEYPQDVSWYISFNGKQIGAVKASTPNEFQAYANIGLQNIKSGTPPKVGNTSLEFAGFPGEKIHRPLMTISESNFQDFASWKLATVTTKLRQQGLNLLQSKFPILCKSDSAYSTESAPFNYTAKNLDIKAYQSKNGWLVMSIHVEGADYCPDSNNDESFVAQTFAIDKAGQSKYLGAGLQLVDTGDYDKDGHSEILFFLSQYNLNGYILFSDKFTELAAFKFSYH